MEAYKKLEIVINTLEVRRLVDLLNTHEIGGYTYWKGVKGRGDRGLQDGEGLTEAFSNAYFMVGCTEAEFERIREPIRDLLQDVGGVCMISDVQWLAH
jgi:nitrogen regulatory protein PII